MTIHGAAALMLATFIFAAIPGPGVTAVVAQAMGRGLKHALLWSAGLVMGDAAYLMLALFGMGWVARELGGAFAILKWIGAGYLVYLGVRCFMAKRPESVGGDGPDSGDSSHSPALPDLPDSSALPDSSDRGVGRPRLAGVFLGGFCVSVGNPKVIAFYCGFLPGFVDMRALSGLDIACVVAIILPTVYGVIAAYAWLAARGRNMARSGRLWKVATRGAGAAMIGAGAAVAAS